MTNGDLILQSFLRHNIPTFVACQLADFEAFLKIDGVPSRGYQERAGLPPTPQVTDVSDKAKGLWDLVFASMQDLGSNFHSNGRVPNPYGPILLVIDPQWLSGVQDASVALLSGGYAKFQRDKHSIPLTRLEEVFVYPYTDSPEIRSRTDLQKLFGQEIAHSNPELSALLPDGYIPLNNIMRIIVDPYLIGEVSLLSRCEALLKYYNKPIVITERSIPSREFFVELGEAVNKGCNESRDFVMHQWRMNDVQNWANSLHTSVWAYQVERWAAYLRVGTIEQLKKVV